MVVEESVQIDLPDIFILRSCSNASYPSSIVPNTLNFPESKHLRLPGLFLLKPAGLEAEELNESKSTTRE